MPLLPQTAPGGKAHDPKLALFWMAVVASVAFLVLLSRLYQLQILRGEEYKGRADENFVKELRVPADRGLILDRNHRILVDSRPSYDVTLTPYFCGKQCDDILSRLATMLSMSADEVERARSQLKNARKLERFRPFTVKVDVTASGARTVIAVQTSVALVDGDGRVDLVESTARASLLGTVPEGRLAAYAARAIDAAARTLCEDLAVKLGER